MQRLLAGIFVCFLATVHVFATDRVQKEWMALPKGEGNSFVMSSSLLRISALEFDGLTADWLFLKAFIFIGTSLERKETPRVKPWEWKWFSDILNAAADLDPYFLDPYYLGNANLTWDGGKIQEANLLLEKGNRARTWDAGIPFYLGFNHFYFLRDNEKASQYLMEAARRPGANPMFARLAVKLAYKENRTENAILFLVELIRKTEDPALRKQYETRLEAFKATLYLENAVETYRKIFRKAPRNLDELITDNIIPALPRDPYGGAFHLDPSGAIRSTSDFELLPHHR